MKALVACWVTGSMERLYDWLFLKAIRGLGEVSIKKLFLDFGSAKNILSATYEDCRRIIGEERAKALFKKDLSFDPEAVIKTLEIENIGWLTLEDENYPIALKEIDDPPPVLFFLGNLEHTPLIGIVGTRRPDVQSLNFIRSLVTEVVNVGYGVCSGGAVGCDFQSHRECLLQNGYTVCVLGMGLLKTPTYIQKLRGRLLLLSELLPEASPEEYTFPRRNRLISGLSRALVVAEAGERSGALITAEYAVKQGRPLWVYVGNASSQRWLGCIKLVNEGKAKILYSPALLFERLPPAHSHKEPLLELLSTPKTFDQLLQLTNMDPSELNLKLLQLEMEGKLIRQGNYYTVLL
ncbi:MAG: DNA-processing protein DprA [Aquificaceae bacterium]|nr:DNA-processing protein DprA [Aquificaceae bacterium]MDW8424028.1 DNA-processing protein DprA [Aquificaceae bacterium]